MLIHIATSVIRHARLLFSVTAQHHKFWSKLIKDNLNPSEQPEVLTSLHKINEELARVLGMFGGISSSTAPHAATPNSMHTQIQQGQ